MSNIDAVFESLRNITIAVPNPAVAAGGSIQEHALRRFQSADICCSNRPVVADSEMRRNMPVKMNWWSGQTEYQ